MTSKEKIVEIINKYLWKFDIDKLADELFEEFEKDLEVLDILKKHFHFRYSDFEWGKMIYSVGIKDHIKDVEELRMASDEITEGELKIIKEWLENDRR